MINIGNSWDSILADEFNKDYYLKLREFLKEEYRTQTVYPDMHDIFNAFKYTDYNDVKVVILGQDPYHEPMQAQGLSFSVPKGVRIPPSLVNIYKELNDDMGIPVPSHGCLKEWASEGVLLLNAVLTVRKGNAGSHAGKGWEILTDRVIELLNEREKPMVFILWGAYAQKKAALINERRHCVIKSVHPSPLSAYRGFFGGRYFSRANGFLEIVGQEPVDWTISE
ncbi:MAG: uracil-DNA glycosylase [Clostridiales bacterium]|nr:uracil-DNA glycosylase [Clostridiales bacterium]MDD6540403.1 uracil-DNA glycosylase [Bacillota bacterium]MDD7015613.1 uracil-DNA glycosylase [Bacillota bacterium]